MKPRGLPTLARRGLALAIAGAGLGGCVTSTVRDTVYDRGLVQAVLRGQKRGGEYVDRGYAHPVVISNVRLINILSMIDIRVGAKRRPAIATELLEGVASALAEGLSKAGPGQEVLVLAVDKQRRWNVFTHSYLTSFSAYVMGNDLYVHLARIDWEIPERRRDRLPEPNADEEVMRFTIVPDDLIASAGTQAVRLPWRDPAFRRASRVRRTASGELIRRTVLMEEPLVAPDVEQPPSVDDVDSPAVLRALAELEEERQRGDLSESEYRARRAKILEEAADAKRHRGGAQTQPQTDAPEASP